MSELVKTSKSWHEYNQMQLLIYISKETPDCSFRVKNIKNILHSFKWMLQQISPILRSIIANHCTCKEIPIDDPNFEMILTYAHTKIVHNRPLKELLSLYQSANGFGIYHLMAEITKILEVNIKRETPLDEMKKNSTEDLEKGLKVYTNVITTFSPGILYHFLATLKTKGVDPFLCFDCLKLYLTDDKILGTIKEEFESFNINRDIIKTLLQNIDFSKICLADVKNNLEKSELSDSKKKSLLEEIQHYFF